MDKNQKKIKQKFELKSEIEKRKKDFNTNVQNLKNVQKEIQIKNKELQELIRQEELSTNKKVAIAKKEYQDKIEKQKNEIQAQVKNIHKYRIQFKEISKLEMMKLRQETLHKKFQFTKDLVNAKVKTKKLILENKKEIQIIKKETQRTLLDQKRKYEEKKSELSKEQNIFLENVIQKRKQLEDMKKQHSLDKLEFYREFKNIQKQRVMDQMKKEHELNVQIQNEQKSLHLDILKMKKEKISYKNLIMLKRNQAKINDAKLKNENKQISLSKTIQQSHEEKQNLSANEIMKSSTFINVDDQNANFLIDKKLLPPIIDLKNPIMKGLMVSPASKRAFKIFAKINLPIYSKSLEKLKIPKQEKILIEKIRKFRRDNSLVPIYDYIQFASFMKDKEILKEKVNGIIISTIYNMIKKGKNLSFLGGYFSVIKVKGYRKIVYSKNPKKMSRFSIIHFPESEVTNEFEKILAKKLNDKPFIKISENIVLTNVDNEIKIITDVPFMRR